MYCSIDIPTSGYLIHSVPGPEQLVPAFWILSKHLSLACGFGEEAGREGECLKTLHFSVLVFHNMPRATAKCIRPQHSQILLKSLHNSFLQAKKNRASRKQITVSKQEYLSLTTMALSNQRGRADEPLITCAIRTSASSIPWQPGSGWSSQGPVMFFSPQAWNQYKGPSPSWSWVSRYILHRGCL